jgi:ADP-ribose pyrophosphatase YjhB (NUDIX family)
VDQVYLVKYIDEDEWYLRDSMVGKGETLEVATRREAWEDIGKNYSARQLPAAFNFIRLKKESFQAAGCKIQ